MVSEMISADERLAALAETLKHHDWHYDYSDDHRVWCRGEAAGSWIRGEIKYLNSLGLEQQTQALWEQYCPWSESNKKKSS